MKTILGRLRSSMAVNIIGFIIALLCILGAVVSMLGLTSFTDAFLKEYSATTYHMADTATTPINGDHLDEYLAGEEQQEYRTTKRYLEAYCRRLNVSLIYVICVDQSDYSRFVSVFNPVNNSVDDSEYVEWELGYKRNTTNDEYRRKYKAIYEEGSPYETVYRARPTDGQHPHITTMVPVKNSEGRVAAILCMQRPIRELRDARRPYQLNGVLSTVILSIVAAICVTLYLRRQVITPIRKTSDEAARFARENTKGAELGEISRFHEISDLTASIDKMETDMVQYMENLTSLTAEKERMVTELHLASRIQESSLPHVFPPYPDRREFDLYALMDPARDVGGDFYDFYLIDDDHLGLVIADVSGKGIPAALLMMTAKVIIRNCAMLGRNAGEILELTNEALCTNNQEEMFVTAWVGILEISTGKLTAANAGHEYPAFRSGDGRYELYKDQHGFVLGGMPGMKYKPYEIQLRPGDRLFVYTDGLPEAMDPKGNMFGTDRMLAALNERPESEPEETLGTVRRAADDFVKDAEQFDDLTMLSLIYRGAEGK